MRGGALGLRGFLTVAAAPPFRRRAAPGEAMVAAGSAVPLSGCGTESACLRSSRRFRMRPAITAYLPAKLKFERLPCHRPIRSLMTVSATPSIHPRNGRRGRDDVVVVGLQEKAVRDPHGGEVRADEDVRAIVPFPQ